MRLSSLKLPTDFLSAYNEKKRGIGYMPLIGSRGAAAGFGFGGAGNSTISMVIDSTTYSLGSVYKLENSSPGVPISKTANISGAGFLYVAVVGGGGGSNWDDERGSQVSGSGGGMLVKIPVTAGNYIFYCGAAGGSLMAENRVRHTSNNGYGGAGGNCSGGYGCAQGGDLSGVFKNSVTQANAMTIAGGGGSNGVYQNSWEVAGGNGGYPSGSGAQSGYGGTQSSGGAVEPQTHAYYPGYYSGQILTGTNGSALFGGNGGTSAYSGGNGGGAGYFGGAGGHGGGGHNSKGAGGGSSFYASGAGVVLLGSYNPTSNGAANPSAGSGVGVRAGSVRAALLTSLNTYAPVAQSHGFEWGQGGNDYYNSAADLPRGGALIAWLASS